MANSNDNFSYYHYDPSLAAAVIFIILFLCTTMMHTYQLVRTRTWILIPLVIGGFFEWIGYSARAVSSKQTPNWTLGPYIVQIVLVLVAPTLFAATIYMELGRIIVLVDGEHLALIKKKWLTKVFVIGDIICFLAQSFGGTLMAKKTATAIQNGQHIIIGGIVIQVLWFAFFVLVALTFNLRINKTPTARSVSADIPWRKHLRVLYAASALIMIRSVFRVVEYLQGNDGYILGHEVFLYLFDASLMLGVMVLLNFVHPSEIYALLRGGKIAQGLKLSDIGQSPLAYR